jgi:phosphomannomutase
MHWNYNRKVFNSKLATHNQYNNLIVNQNKLDLIFKAYDVRGIYGDTLTLETAYNIGVAFSEFVQSEKIIVGHDGRTSNLEIFNAIATGIKSKNKDVHYIGTVPTDVVYSLSGLLDLPGLIITASHNPKEWNGFKFCNRGASPIGVESGLLEIKKLASKNYALPLVLAESKKEDVIDIYINHLKEIVNPEHINSSIKFAIDGGNGAIGSVIDSLSSKYGLNYEGIYMDVDGTFPNHPADPSNPKNLEELVNLVLEKNYQFGVAFDGDADRAVFSDDEGNIISGSIMTAIISDWLLAKRGEIKVVHNVNVPPSVTSYLNKKGVNLIRSKVGHSYIKQIMRDEDADFGGEHSAHFYLRENFYADSGIVTLLIFLQILSEKNQTPSELISSYSFFPSSGEINFNVKNVDESISIVKNSFEKEFDSLDGISYFDDDYWFNIRGSNTEPKLRLNAEAKNIETLNELVNKIRNIIER